MTQHFFRTIDLRDGGWTKASMDQALREGNLTRLRRGLFSSCPPLESARPKILAGVEAASDQAVLSHWSAAWLHDLPVPNAAMGRVHLTRGRRSGARISPDLKLYACPLRDGDTMLVGDLPVTTVARTVVDVARHDDRTGWGFATGDRALRLGLTSMEELKEQLRRAARRPWIRLARQIVALLDPLAESPGESRSRWLMFQGGIPQPELQVDVSVMGGRVIYTPDFMWPEYGVLGEFDGDYKYELTPGTDAWKAAKRRDEALQAEGWVVIHWAWEDLANPVAFIARLRNAFFTARRLRERAS